MRQGFNIQFLQLQNRISRENGRFTMAGNVMKNKRDTAKNAIDNVRRGPFDSPEMN